MRNEIKKANWIMAKVEEFARAENANPYTIGAVVVRDRVTVLDIADTTTPKIGVAICSPDDDFDLNTGLAIAWARMTEQRVPDWVINDVPDKVCISKVRIGQHFMHDDREWVKTTTTKLLASGAIACVCYCIDTDNVYNFRTAESGGEMVTPIH